LGRGLGLARALLVDSAQMLETLEQRRTASRWAGPADRA
jgi:hypothetical protein